MMGKKNLSNKTIARRSERWGFWALIVAIVVVLSTAYFAIRLERFQTRLAIASGSLDKAIPMLYVGGQKTDWPLTIAYGAPFPQRSDTVVYLPLQIKNDGNKTTKSVEVFITEPAYESVDSEFLTESTQGVLPASVNLKRYFMKDAKFAHISYLIPDLNPDQEMQIDEPIAAEESTRTIDGALTKNGLPILYKQVTYFFLPISVSISGEDLHTSTFRFEIVGVRANSADELDKFFDGLIKMRLQEQPAPSLWARITNKIAPIQGRGLLLMPTFDKYTMADGYTEFIGKPDSTGTVTEYSFHLR
jgi:hypothetical protein